MAGAAWQFWPRPLPDFTAEDLASAYSGMVRADGTNQVSVLTAGDLTEPPAKIVPDRCAPLFETTVSNQFPAGALDGVSTYWLKEGSASIALVTYRFADAKAAQRQFSQVAGALTDCLDTRLRIDRRSNVSVVQQSVTPPPQVDNYTSYLVSSPPATTRITIDVAQLTNTVTWQYRYDYERPAHYSPLAAQQLMGALVAQLQDVRQRPR